ncbi:hypothetical protein LN42_05805 [Marinitoga sp. 1137]|uniref:D-alanine--D-alanine ligase family protein n=1 Tax=Marinitoga sp. 1137 TaxID=1545835 RepID=UPI0009506665|nr:D-alanine--D-alanine ligase [Marinitoga sp. 1137]APT75948.1 hypothetical protein LN42_05805 [Marinitoga sp. 1137]
MNYKIALIYGGNSNEREVSIRSAKNIAMAIVKNGYSLCKYDLKTDWERFVNEYKIADLVFNIVHGYEGEDGTLQRKLEKLGIEYIGSDSNTSEKTFDKWAFIQSIKKDFSVPKSFLTDKYIEPPLDFPLIIKPRKSGSSLGIHICHNLDEYNKFLKEELQNFGEIIIQEYIKGREISVSIIQKNDETLVLPILEIKPKNEFYDYEAKYTEGYTDFEVPAKLEKDLEEKIIKDFKKLFLMMNIRDFCRIDAIIKNDKYYILEINTIPGMTELSDLPQSAAAYGLSFEELVDILIKNHLKD